MKALSCVYNAGGSLFKKRQEHSTPKGPGVEWRVPLFGQTRSQSVTSKWHSSTNMQATCMKLGANEIPQYPLQCWGRRRKGKFGKKIKVFVNNDVVSLIVVF